MLPCAEGQRSGDDRRDAAQVGPRDGTAVRPVAPGWPRENRSCESFNGALRDACLRQHIVSSPEEAQVEIGPRQDTCDRVRRHASPGCRPPAPVSVPDLALRLPMTAAMQ
jgi:putative transposase